MKITGFCPTLQRDNAIYVSYNIQSSCLAEETQYLKGYFDCDYARQFSKSNKCPIYKSAPNQL